MINFKCLNDHVKMNKLCKSMNTLQVKDIIYELEMSKFMHSFYHKKLLEVFNNYFKSAKKTSNVTRSVSKKN